MSHKITVTISGPLKCGKSTLAGVIAAALKPVGCFVSLDDDDTMASLLHKYLHARKILRNTHVRIKTETVITRVRGHDSTCIGPGSCTCQRDP